ncbi:hypothetical protein EDD38_4060 [Kitasatospora cineracea]|uniref:Uncharacterized protein n=1 Tax=Kitasatospora cineracea TaxID=88074 RepID=A0A3N4RS54_9ACTN|nr:hypothetical protein EDD38_4060 [Kitasatospora cineracea]
MECHRIGARPGQGVERSHPDPIRRGTGTPPPDPGRMRRRSWRAPGRRRTPPNGGRRSAPPARARAPRPTAQRTPRAPARLSPASPGHFGSVSGTATIGTSAIMRNDRWSGWRITCPTGTGTSVGDTERVRVVRGDKQNAERGTESCHGVGRLDVLRPGGESRRGHQVGRTTGRSEPDTRLRAARPAGEALGEDMFDLRPSRRQPRAAGAISPELVALYEQRADLPVSVSPSCTTDRCSARRGSRSAPTEPRSTTASTRQTTRRW